MTNEKYTANELVKETAREMKLPELVEGIAGVAIQCAETLAYPYIVSTMSRRCGYTPVPKCIQEGYTIQGWGRKGHIGTLLTAVPITFAALNDQLPTFYSIFLATNAASWAYEKFRTAKKNLEVRSEIK